jgi:putative membrane protein
VHLPAYHRALLATFAVVWLALAVDPADRGVWAAENLFVLALAAGLWLLRDHVAFSSLSATGMFVFLCLHAVGSHHTYAEVPYDAWLRALTGTSLREQFGIGRNHYDRLVHFAFGLLLTWPMREVLVQTSPVRGRWSYLLPVALSMAASMAYEVAEWLAVTLVAGEAQGAALLGMQGDTWDSQKDMALGAVGAMAAMSLAVGLRREQPARRAERRSMRHGATGRPLASS